MFAVAGRVRVLSHVPSLPDSPPCSSQLLQPRPRPRPSTPTLSVVTSYGRSHALTSPVSDNHRAAGTYEGARVLVPHRPPLDLQHRDLQCLGLLVPAEMADCDMARDMVAMVREERAVTK